MKTDSVIIRKAIKDDFEWVVDIMQKALNPYYGGDHNAHACRIFDAHIKGGYDHIGFFSFEQRMFVLEINNVRAGMIHLVGKRQLTYKISPLIVVPKFRGKLGIGSRLLDYAEKYARNQNARQIYCTVADKNIGALQFFLRKGFIKAGSSDSHYKYGMTEIMLYKLLYKVEAINSFDKSNVSVLPFNEKSSEMKKQVLQLLLEKLPPSFDGITEKWTSALFDGYRRRNTANVNAKYKLIYVALNSKNKVIGVAAATPKKGSPIKIMPLLSINLAGFEALLIDLPYQLVTYGHKLYIHISPTADEVISLQRLGWKLDAAMPSAYRLGVVTQQWSLNIGEKTMRTMRTKKRFLELIRSNKKNLEVRVGYDTINRIQVGERIKLMSHASSLDVRVNAIRRYKTFEAMLEKESYKRIAPDLSSKHETLSLFKSIYHSKKEKLGVVVLELVSINN